MSVLFYRRPDYLNKASGPINETECARYVERAKSSESAIPDGLSFEDVINNKSLPPCSLNDFMDYLIYVEHSAENLQFYLWYRDYVQRFEALPEAERALSPEWIPPTEAPKLVKDQGQTEAPKSSNIAGLNKLMKRRFGSMATGLKSPIYDSNALTFAEELDEAGNNHPASITIVRSDNDSFVSKITSPTTQAHAGQKWEPFSIQPMRDEINRLTHHYLLFSSPRELNLSHRDRAAILHALQHTTHPSALFPALNIVETTLRGQAHPNFIRWSICNGNKPRVFFVRTMGISNTLFGFIIAILLTLSHASRWYRILAAVEWFLGISTLVAAYKGLCIIMHHSHVRNLRPWEQPLSDLEDISPQRNSDDSGTAGNRSIRMASRLKNEGGSDDTSSGFAISRNSLQSFGEKNSYDFEGQEWVERYKKKNLLRKVFDANVWTQDETLRVLQDKIVLGANIWAAISTVILTIFFVALPKGNLY